MMCLTLFVGFCVLGFSQGENTKIQYSKAFEGNHLSLTSEQTDDMMDNIGKAMFPGKNVTVHVITFSKLEPTLEGFATLSITCRADDKTCKPFVDIPCQFWISRGSADKKPQQFTATAKPLCCYSP